MQLALFQRVSIAGLTPEEIKHTIADLEKERIQLKSPIVFDN